MPRSSRPAQRARPATRGRPGRPTRAPAPKRPAVLQDAAQDVGDLFDECVRHVVQDAEFPEVFAGPVRALPLDEREAGTFGWVTTLARDAASATAGTSVGDVFLFVLPRIGRASSRPRDPPLLGSRWGEFAAVDFHAGPPRLLLLSRAVTSSRGALLRRWSRALFERLRLEMD